MSHNQCTSWLYCHQFIDNAKKGYKENKFILASKRHYIFTLYLQ